ncbi:hypothetical protein SAMN02745216_02995 [Desulfatibacillum alkenivorans DSM 16219]|uniref:Uncharacterized protein n=1 Tax=Desulfatibacillum alkenivorans DSM 16219 TaxID=1121393 RepID=A0A1M6Q8F9_9BACT|nr:hypothetical protein [Desulfatibacillum alkenivorans]SHK16532.1 hypothetical protein SAMN02745216_02995 [Desulfatibacillum alkenivorans DSM 16219]
MPKTTTKTTNLDSAQNEAVNLDPRWIVKIEGRDFVTYPGLLDLGHQKGLESIEVEPLQLPNDQNGFFAVCKAVVTSKNGETFTDIGDANPQNTSSRVSKHLLRMASTRSIARALRTFTNIGMTCLEELDGDFSAKDQGNNAAHTSPRKQAPKAAPKSQAATPKTSAPSQGTKPAMSDSQKRAIYAISKRQGMNEEDINALTVELFNRDFDHLNVHEASSVISHLQNNKAAA